MRGYFGNFQKLPNLNNQENSPNLVTLNPTEKEFLERCFSFNSLRQLTVAHPVSSETCRRTGLPDGIFSCQKFPTWAYFGAR
jgi:hypothetical protein